MTTTEPTLDAVEELARIHGQHRYVDVRGDYEVGDGRRYFGCSCGWTHDVDGMSGYRSWVEEHERHAARAVLAAGYVDQAPIRALLTSEIADEIESRVRAARGDVRCFVCNLRYEERQEYGCQESGRGHSYDDSDLAAAEEIERAGTVEHITLSVADLRAALDPGSGS